MRGKINFFRVREMSLALGCFATLSPGLLYWTLPHLISQLYQNIFYLIVVTVDASHHPVEFFHLHAGIADYFHHGGKPF